MTTLSRERFAAPIILSTLALTLGGCRVVGGIFKAGVWVGVLVVFVVLGLMLWAVKSMKSP